MDAFMKNWKSTAMGFVPLIPYVLQFFGLWPAIIPLPDFATVWPSIAGSIGLGAIAKDYNMTGK